MDLSGVGNAPKDDEMMSDRRVWTTVAIGLALAAIYHIVKALFAWLN